MPQSADANHANSIGGLDAVIVESVEHGRAAAHQRRSIRVGDCIGNCIEIWFIPHSTVRKGTLVQVGHPIHMRVLAVNFHALQALIALAAGVGEVAPEVEVR